MLHNLDRELKLNNFASKLPPTVENVRKSCKAVADSPQCAIEIDEIRAREFINNIDIKSLKKASHYRSIFDALVQAGHHVTLLINVLNISL